MNPVDGSRGVAGTIRAERDCNLFGAVSLVSSPLEVSCHVFPRADVYQQPIESRRCDSKGLEVRIRGGPQHLIETARSSHKRFKLFTRDRLLASLVARLYQAHNSVPDFAIPILFFVLVSHGPTATDKGGNLTQFAAARQQTGLSCVTTSELVLRA